MRIGYRCAPLLALLGPLAAATLSGRVTDQIGAAVPSAEVTLVRGTQHWRAVTDAGGRYRLDDVPRGRSVLLAHNAGYRGRRREVTLPADLATAGELRLTDLAHAPGVVAGRLVRADERPSAGVRIGISRETLPFLFEQQVAKVTADEAGWYEVSGLAPGRYRLLPERAQLERSRMASARFEGDIVQVGGTAGVGRDLGYSPRPELLPACKIPLQLCLPDGAPAARRWALVQLSVLGSWADAMAPWEPWPGLVSEPPGPWDHAQDCAGWLRADAAGRATVTVPPGLTGLRVGQGPVEPYCLAPGEVAPVLLVTGDFATGADHPSASDIGPPQRKLRCHIVDAKGAALARRRVCLYDSRSRWLTEAVVETDDRGDVVQRVPAHFKWPALAARSVKVPGWAESSQELPEELPGGDLEVTLRVDEPARRVSGRVVDAAGAPVAGAWVFAQTIRITGDLSGWCSARHWCESWDWTEIVPSPAAAGMPASWLRRGYYYANADATGRFTFDQLDFGDVNLVAYKPGLGPTAAITVLTTAASLEGVVLAPTSGQEPIIGGRVVGPDGAALAGVVVELHDGDAFAAHAASDAAGSFAFEAEPTWEPGSRLLLRFNDERWLVAQDDLTPGFGGVGGFGGFGMSNGRGDVGVDRPYHLRRSSTLRGTVVGPNGRPVPHAWIVARPESYLPRLDTFADEHGHFELAGYARELEELTVSAAGMARMRLARLFARPTELTVRLHAGRCVRGRVVDRGGRPLRGAGIAWQADVPDGVQSTPPFQDGGGAGWFSAVTDEEGRYCLDAVPLGPVTAYVSGGALPPEAATDGPAPPYQPRFVVLGDEPATIVLQARSR